MKWLNQHFLTILTSILLTIGCVQVGYSQQKEAEEPDRKCHVEYSFDLISGETMAHFGRWATPFDKRSQDLCLGDWKELKSVEPESSTKNLPSIFKIENEDPLTGVELSGYLEMDVNDDGEVFILDIHKKEVFVFDQDLKFKNSFGSEAGFKNVSDLIVERGKVYVSDPYLQKITIFSEEGELLQRFDVNNQAVDMAIIDGKICTHTGGAIPIDGNVITCYKLDSGEFISNLLQPSQRMNRMPWGTSNTTFSTIQVYENQMYSVSHPMEGIITVFDEEGDKISTFTVENEVYQLAEFPEKYEVLQNLPFDYMQSLIHGIHVFSDQIMVLFVENETGIKYLDFYDLEGNRLIDEVIDIEKMWPIYNDQKGNLYSFTSSENDSNFILKKYKYLK